MKIDSPHFGALEIDPAKTIEFPQGLPGFEHCHRFSLLHQEGADLPIVYALLSLDDPAVAFSVSDPGLFGFNYQLTLSDEEVTLIGLSSPDEAAVVVILRRPDLDSASGSGSQARVTANVMAPIVINTRTRLALQQVIARVGFDVTFRPA